MYSVAFIPDRCIGCRACQTACKIWNGKEAEATSFSPTFTNPEDLTPNTYTIVKFIEGEGPSWLMLKWQCLHCSNAPCARACPADAIEVHPEGAVVIKEDKCVGCGYCVEACPFNIPRIDEERGKAYKCTMCIDRIQAGKLPACVEACPTEALIFGKRDEVIAKLKSMGYEVYGADPLSSDTGYTHWLYATKEFKGKLTDPEVFGLPKSPKSVNMGLIEAMRGIGMGLAGLAVIASLAHAVYWRTKKESK